MDSEIEAIEVCYDSSVDTELYLNHDGNEEESDYSGYSDLDSDDDYDDVSSASSDTSEDGIEFHNVPILVHEPDEMCLRLDRMIRNGLLSKQDVLYKFIDDVSTELENPQGQHVYSEPVIELCNTIRYHGGSSAILAMRGPMWKGCGRGGHQNPELAKPNLGGPSLQTLRKHTAGYTFKSGVNKFWLLSFLKLTNDALPLFANDKLKVIPIVLQNDGTALKPSIQFDKSQQLNVGLDPPSSYTFVHNHPEPSPEFLGKHVILESNITCAATLDNAVFMPIAATYKTGSNKSALDMEQQFLDEVTIVQTCMHCLEGAIPNRHILTIDSVSNCISECQQCLTEEDVCEECLPHHTSHLPPLRACMRCIELGIECVRCVVFAIIADCETGNRKAAENLISARQRKENPSMVAAFIPDPVHVAKSLKASFANWPIVLNKERACLNFMHTIRDADPGLRNILRKDCVQNRDRMCVDSLLHLTHPTVCAYLESPIVHSIVPDR